MGPYDAQRRPPAPPRSRQQVSHVGAVSDWYAIRPIPMDQLDIAGILSSADVAVVHRRRPAITERTEHANARAKGLHLAVTDGGVFVIEACPWRWRRSDRGALGILDADAAVAELARDADGVEEVLAGVGLSPNEIRPVLVSGYAEGAAFTYGRVWLAGPERLEEVLHAGGLRLSDHLQSTVLEHLAALYTDKTGEPSDPPQGPGDYPLDPDEWNPKPLLVASAATHGRLESWMQRIPRDQMKVVRSSNRGPALVRAAPGVAAHAVVVQRSAYLADRLPGRILVTAASQVRVDVLASEHRRLSPTTLERVDFATVHGFALQILADRGIACSVDELGLESAFRRAWSRLDGLGLGLGSWGPPERWRQEILGVVKGGGLASFEQYQRSSRARRSALLPGAHRREAWDLHLAYAEELARSGLHDWYDVVLLARDSLRAQPLEPGYRAVIADEVDDAPPVALQLLHRLVGDRPDGLLLVGGAFADEGPDDVAVWGEVGIDISGRSSEVRAVTGVSYAASRIWRVDEDRRPPRSSSTPASTDTDTDWDGKPVRHDVAADRDDHDRQLLARLREDLAEGVPSEEIALLCPNDRLATHYRRLLSNEGLPVAEPGAPANLPGCITVAPVSRGRGRSYDVVFIPADDPVRPLQRTDQMSRGRTERFAAMTAARERLWVGTVDPSRG